MAGVVALLRNLERSKLGRAWMAVREDELAATCMGMNAAGVKLSSFAIGSALAGLAGALFAASYDNTQGPDAYTFNRSITESAWARSRICWMTVLIPLVPHWHPCWR